VKLITSNWLCAILVGVFMAFVGINLAMPSSARADDKPQTKTCFAWVICSKDKPDPNVDQSVQPGPEFNKLPRKAQEMFTRTCFTVHYDATVRNAFCNKYFPGYVWHDPKSNWNIRTAIDPVHQAGQAVKAAANSAVGGWVGDAVQGLTKSAAEGVASLLKDIAKLVQTTTTPTFSAKWFTVIYAEIFGLGTLIAVALVAIRMIQGVAQEDASQVIKGPAALIAFVVGGGLIPWFVTGLVALDDKKIAPGLLSSANQNLDHVIFQLTHNLDSVEKTGLAWIVLLVIALIGVLGGVVVEFMLYFREIMLYVLVPAEVLALALWVGGQRFGGFLAVTTSNLMAWILLPSIMAFVTKIALGLINSHQNANPVILGTIALVSVPIIGSWAMHRITMTDMRVKERVGRAVQYGRSMSWSFG